MSGLVLRSYLLLGLSLTALATSQAQAQVVTNITSDTAPGFETGTTVVTNGTQTEIGGGQLSGTNLFHSFGNFDLGSADIATWVRNAADAGAITNVINRVRSGTPSQIDGTIAMADMPNAAFWFINPAGVVFGSDASVQVPNAAYFSTAHDIGFAGGERFSTVTPDGSTFSSAAPAAFGFLGGQGGIILNAGFGQTGGASELTLVGGNVEMEGEHTFNGPALTLVAVGNGGPFSLATDGLTTPIGDGRVALNGGARLDEDAGAGVVAVGSEILIEAGRIRSTGDIALRGGTITTVNGSIRSSGGDILLTGENIDLTGFVDVSTFTNRREPGNFNDLAESGDIVIDATNRFSVVGDRFTQGGNFLVGKDITISANSMAMSLSSLFALPDRNGIKGVIDIDVATDITLSEVTIGRASFTDPTEGAGGEVNIRAGGLQAHFTNIFSDSRSIGAAGDVTINVGTLDFQRSSIRTSVFDLGALVPDGSVAGDAGAISITADNALISGVISSQGGTGNAGTVLLDVTDTLVLRGAFISSAAGLDGGNGGGVLVRAGALDMLGGSIVATTPSQGDAGTVTLDVGTALIVDGLVSSSTTSTGGAGTVAVRANSVLLVGTTLVSSETQGNGNAGSVTFDVAGEFTLQGNARVTSSTNGNGNLGNAGSVAVRAATLRVDDNAQIDSSTREQALGDAGSVDVEVGMLAMNGGFFYTSTYGAGNAGNLTVHADDIALANGTAVNSRAVDFATGNAGNVAVTASNSIQLRGAASISASSDGSGSAGTVQVTTPYLSLDTGGFIDSAAMAGGNAGNTLINVGSLMIDGFGFISSTTGGSGNAGNVTVNADSVLIGDGQINSSARVGATGNAGSVAVNALDSITITGFGEIIAKTSGPGSAGTVDIVTDALTMLDGSVSSSTEGAGDAGNVRVTANAVALSGIASIGSQASPGSSGQAGSVVLDVADSVTLRDNSSILAFTLGSGNAGSITIDTGLLDMQGGIISSTSGGLGDAGAVLIDTGTALLRDGVIASNTQGSGAGGKVVITAQEALLSGNMRVSSQTLGSGHAGIVAFEIASTLSLADDALISSTTEALTDGGDAGSVTIQTQSLTIGDDARIDSSTLGSGLAGNLTIAANSALLTGNALISSQASGGSTGGAGNVKVTVVDDFTLIDNSRISASTNSVGDAGFVVVTADTLAMNGGSIESSTQDRGDAGNVFVTARNAHLTLDARINSSALDGSLGDAGNVFLTATETLTIADDSAVVAVTRGEGDAGLVQVRAAQLQMTGGAIASSSEGAGDAGDVLIDADMAVIAGNARVNSGTLQGSTGNAGLVGITTRDLLFVGGDAVISASTAGPGAAGAVQIATDELAMNGGEIASFTRGDGNAGTVSILANDVLLANKATVNSQARDGSTGAAGGVLLNVDGQLVVSEFSEISAATFGSGEAGVVEVHADDIVLDGGAISSSTTASGNAGDVLVTANTLAVLFAGQISSTAGFGTSGAAGDVIVNVADVLRIEPGGAITASSSGSGDAGLVDVHARVLDMVGGAINSFTSDSGNAGLVGVFVDELAMSGGRIDSASDSDQPNAGHAGSVLIQAGMASISGDAQIDSRGITGDAGDVTLQVAGALDLSGAAQISAATTGAGTAGEVRVMADELTMTGGAINSFTSGSGNAGFVTVTSRNMTMIAGLIDSSSESSAVDAGDAGGVLVRGSDILLAGQAQIISRGVTGNAGDVTLEVMGPLSINEDVQVSAATSGSGNAGSVFVTADLLEMTGGTINSVTTGSGMAGSVGIDVGDLLMTGGRISSASEGPLPTAGATVGIGPVGAVVPAAGDAGNVLVTASSITLDGQTSIDSSSRNSNAGTVGLLADDVVLDNGGQVSTAALGGGDAGDIGIETGTLLLDHSSRITSTAAGNFSAGTITITAGQIRIYNGSQISTNSDNGPAGDIGLFLPTDGFLGLAGRDPGVITTSSGANTGGQIIIANPFLILSEGGSILALGQQGGANVQIQSAFFIRSSDAVNLVSVDGSLLIESNVGEQITGTEVAEVPFLDASGILSGQCSGVRQSGEVSQFSSRITGPYAPPAGVIEDGEQAVPEDGDGTPAPIASLVPESLAPCS